MRQISILLAILVVAKDNRKSLYWAAQFSGWLVYLSFVLIYNLFGSSFSWEALVSTLLILVVGIPVTHLYRFIIIRLNWLRYPLLKAIPRILLCSTVLGVLFFVLHDLLTQIFVARFVSFFELAWVEILRMLLNWMFVLVFWSMLYFTAHYFFNYRRQEIANLKLEASRNEIELSNLKSQLNPHFMFNALNGIRALVEDEPESAKQAITQLSVLLRAALSTGKQKTIRFKEELNLVANYLSLEKMRFEDRLRVSYDIHPEINTLDFPPLMLQTVVENAVKHGISKLPKGGEISISGKATDDFFVVEVWNSGAYTKADNPEEMDINQGIGLKNTQRRLRLIFGKNASLTIENWKGGVRTQLLIPKEAL